MSVLNNCFRFLFGIAFTIIVLLLSLLFAIFFIVYRKCVGFILRKKIGEKYAGFLNGYDHFFASHQDVSNSVINILFMVESAENNFSSIVKQTFKSRFFDAPERLAKFTGVLKQAYGYYYVVKDEYSVDECVREVQEEVKDVQHLQEIFDKYGNLPLPKNHTTFWEVLVCKNRIKWNDSKNCFPIILRFNHSMSDGMNLVHVLLKFLNDDPLINESKPIVPEMTKLEKVFLRLKKILFDAYLMIRLPSFFLSMILNVTVDSNALTSTATSRKVTLAWKIEDGEIVSKIKKIKNSFPDTTFTDVLITALSATCEEYFAKNCSDVPENFTILYPINFNPPDMFEKPPVLLNNIGVLLMSTPVRWKSSLIDKLKEVKSQEALAKRNYSIQSVHLMYCVIQNYLPTAIMKPKAAFLTLTMSNLRCPAYCTMFGGQLVETINCVCLTGCSGMTIFFSNYGHERFQICVTADQALIKSAEEMNVILDGIGKYVNVMYQELNLN